MSPHFHEFLEHPKGKTEQIRHLHSVATRLREGVRGDMRKLGEAGREEGV